MTQLAMFTVTPPQTRCAFGETGEGWTGPHHCHQCAAEVERGCAAFDAAVAAGTFDAEGYRPAERRALERRRQRHA